MTSPPINTKITADPSGLVRGVSVARGSLAGLQKQLGDLQSMSAQGFSLSGLAGIPLSATAAAAALVTLVRSAADYGDKLDNMSQRTGIAVDDLSKLQYAAQMSDTSMEALSKGVTSLSNLVVAASSGAETSAAMFQKYGVAVRNADGSVRSSMDVLGDLAELFSTMPDGAQKTALATEFFGKKLGIELIPLLNMGRDGLKSLGDEAERLGLVLSSGQAKAAAEFNDNMDRLSAAARGAGISIGNALIPTISEYLQKLNDANGAGLTLSDRLFVGLRNGQDPAKVVAELSSRLDELKAKRDKIMAGPDGAASGAARANADEIASIERRLEYYNAGNKKIEMEEAASGKRREVLQAQLAGKIVQLEKLRAIAAGQSSADILKSDKDLNDARIKDAERLRDALRSAYEASARDAKSASTEAVSLLDRARQKRNSAADNAAEASTSGLSQQAQASAAAQRAESLFGEGKFYAAAAGAARLDGRLEKMAAYQKTAEEYLDRAEKFAQKSGNAGLVQDIANAQASMLEQQAAAKQKEADAANQRAGEQMALLNDTESRLNAMITAAANFEIKADVTQLEADIARIKQQIESGATMPINAATAGSAPGFWGGGWTGPGGKYQPAGIVHADEFVTRQEIVRQPGALAFLHLFNRVGMSALRGYADGGLVGRMPMPAAPAGSGSRSQTPLVLDMGALGKFRTEASRETAEQLVTAVRRASMSHRRRN